jgi:hypothetical protein
MHVSNHNFEHVAPVYAQEKSKVFQRKKCQVTICLATLSILLQGILEILSIPET